MKPLLLLAFTFLIACTPNNKGESGNTTTPANSNARLNTPVNDTIRARTDAEKMYTALLSENIQGYLFYLDDDYVKKTGITKDSIKNQLKAGYILSAREHNTYAMEGIEVLKYQVCNTEKEAVFKVHTLMNLHGQSDMLMNVTLFGYTKDTNWKYFVVDSNLTRLSMYHPNACIGPKQ